MMRFPMLHDTEELASLVQEIGFLPFFRNEIAGFSVEDCTPSEYWFAGGVDSPWEWKGKLLMPGNTPIANCSTKGRVCES